MVVQRAAYAKFTVTLDAMPGAGRSPGSDGPYDGIGQGGWSELARGPGPGMVPRQV